MDNLYHNKILRSIYYSLPPFLMELAAYLYSLKVHRRRYGGVFLPFINKLIKGESLSYEERMTTQISSLRQMLVYAGTNSPFYRELFSNIGFDPSSLQSVGDLQRIPALQKDHVRTQGSKLIAENFQGPIMKNHTSGTTGAPLYVTLSEEAHQRHYACLWYHFTWVGFHPGDAIATFAGHQIAAPDRKKPPFWLYDRRENDLMFSSFHLTPSTISYYAGKLKDFNPVIIRGYPSLIYLIALHVIETGMEIRPKGIFTYAETTFDKQRTVIEEAFKCPVYSSYGNGEHVGHLLQCREGNFHEVTESGVIEVIRPDGELAKPGEAGELVITSLINDAMPMIRYRTGDIGVKTEGLCTCGRTSPILKEIIGRIADFIVTPDGRHVSHLNYVFEVTSNIKEAQLVQEKIDELTVNLVVHPDYNDNDKKLILAGLRSLLGDEMKITIQVVDEIQRTKEGKLKFVNSRVPIQFSE